MTLVMSGSASAGYTGTAVIGKSTWSWRHHARHFVEPPRSAHLRRDRWRRPCFLQQRGRCTSGQSRAAATTGEGICILTPEVTEGPYHADPKLERSDIRDGHAGVPLELKLMVIEAETCKPVAGASRRLACGPARQLLGLRDAWPKLERGCRQGPVPTPPSDRRCQRYRQIHHDLARMVPRPHSARSLQGLARTRDRPWRVSCSCLRCARPAPPPGPPPGGEAGPPGEQGRTALGTGEARLKAIFPGD